MTQTIVYYLIALNIVTFFVYGIDKWKAVSQRGQSQTRLSFAERKQARTKSKAKRAKWRIREAALFGLAVLGGSIGALLGMKVWHHKTMHKGGTRDVDNIVGGYQFKYGLPLILLAQIALIAFTSCKSKQTLELSTPINIEHKYAPEHSPNVFLIMYDAEIGKDPLLKAIKEYGCEIVYDYGIINGMALKKPESKTLEETMAYFKKVKGVTHVEYDNIIRLTDPIKPKLEIQ